jgi:hypothetical protein
MKRFVSNLGLFALVCVSTTAWAEDKVMVTRGSVSGTQRITFSGTAAKMTFQFLTGPNVTTEESRSGTISRIGEGVECQKTPQIPTDLGYSCSITHTNNAKVIAP